MSGSREGSGHVADVSWPLVGRERELEAVTEAMAQPGSSAFLVGELGCGKTRVAREALDQLAARGWSTARATATVGASQQPLGALAHLVPLAAADPSASLLRAVHEAIAARDPADPLILHLDDAHHLDLSSASLLVSLVASGALRVIATARRGEVLPEPLAALRSQPEARSIEVGPLDRGATEDLLAAALGGPVDGIARAALWELSQGNPLYLRELVLGGVAAGWLASVSGVWMLQGDPVPTLSLGERILGRLDALGPDAREALELLAVAEPLGLDLIADLASEEAIEALERAGMVRVGTDRRRRPVHVAHPIYAEALRASMGAVRVRRCAARVAGALAALGARRGTDPQLLAQLRLLAGEEADPDELLAAARIARHHNDWVTAARLARAARDAGSGDAPYVLAECHYALGEFDDGDGVAEAALADPDALSPAARTGLHRTRGGVWFFASSSVEDAFGAVEADRAALTDPDLIDMLDYARSIMLAWSGRPEEARALAEPLLSAPDVKVRVQAAIAAETVAATAGPAPRAIELADAWFPVHASLPDLNGTNSPAFHLLVKTEAMVSAGMLDPAGELADFGYQLAVSSRNRIAQMWFARQLGRVAQHRGDAATARAWSLEVVALCRGTSWYRPLALGLSDLALAEAQLGDAAAASAAIAERDALGVPVVPVFASEAARGAAWARAVNGDALGAQRDLVAAADAADAAGIVLLGALARIDAVRLGAPGQAEPLAAAAQRVDSDLVRLGARWAASTGDPNELHEVAEELASMGCLGHAADAYAVAASVRAAMGDARGARSAQRLADELRARCSGGVAHLPASRVEAQPLTPREREIAGLVVEGMTARQVAQHLFLSPRTVSNHLQNIYGKLGVKGRDELGPVLAQLRSDAAV